MTNTLAPLTPAQAIMSARIACEAGLSPYIEGQPGIGKSAVVVQLAKDLSKERKKPVQTEIWIPSTMAGVDARGLPYIEKGKTKWARPTILPEDGEGILFIDELNTAIPSLQAALFGILHGREIAGHKLGKGWWVIGAGNGEKDGNVAVNKMGTPMKSRLVRLKMKSDLEGWCNWAISSGAIGIETVAFVRGFSTFFHAFNLQTDSFPCPRTWEFVDKLRQQKPDAALAPNLYAGCVGEAAAIEYVAFLQMFDQVAGVVDAVLQNGAKAPLPAQANALFAVCGGVSQRANEKNFASVIRYAERLKAERAELGGAEWGMFMVTSTIGRCPAVVRTAEYTKWSVANSHLNT
jgi:hypothetical protein